MSDDIQFGEVQDNQPEPVRSPANDEHFSIARFGAEAPGDLPVFVDLDVFLELENHAVSNTDVELGGVLLGRQAIDENGNPLVIITDSLRAEHYEATRGSFKFTHSTWSEITRRRQQMNDSLQIVGWYHTHPGWGVFLSDMDDFICRNFFGRSLDVALVIDPRQGTRGWFQWNESNTETRQCAGFFLFSNRHRAVELQATILEYSGAGTMAANRPSDHSPVRFQSAPSTLDSGLPTIGTWAMLWMMGLQMLVLALIAWRILVMPGQPVAVSQAGDDPSRDQVAQFQAESRVYRELAQLLLVASGQETGVADELAKLRLASEGMEAANASHVERIAGLENRLSSSLAKVETLEKSKRLLSDKLAAAEQRVGSATNEIANMNLSQSKNGPATASLFQPWLIGILAVALVGLGIIVFRMNRRDFDAELLADRDESRNDLERVPTPSPSGKLVQ